MKKTQKTRNLKQKVTLKNPIERFSRVFFLIVILTIPLFYAITVDWDTQKTYDDFEDNIINHTLWRNVSAAGRIQEQGGHFTILTNVTLGGPTVSVANNLSEIPKFLWYIENITIKANISARDDAGAGTTVAKLSFGGGTIIDLGASGVDRTDLSEWVIIRNYSITESFNFTVYNDGVWNNTLKATTNELKFEVNSGADGTDQCMINVDYVYYALNNETLNISLSTPNNSVIHYSGDNVTFNVTVNATVNELKNATLYIEGVSNETLDFTGTYNSTNFTKDLAGYNEKTWFIEICDNQHNCKNSEERTMDLSLFKDESQTYNETTIEGSTESFVINITYDNNTYSNVQGTLYYNNTAYVGSQTGTGNNILFSSTVITPIVDIDKNISFYWEIGVNNGTWIYENSTETNQTVNNLNIDDCSTYNIPLLNLTLKEENTQDLLNGTLYNSTVEVFVEIFPLGSTSAILNYSQNYSQNNTPMVCLEKGLANSTYEMDVQINYDADAFAAEFYHIQNFSLTNSSLPQVITLYDLNDDDAQTFLITFKDDDFVPVADALIDIQRKYVSEGVFKSIEIPKTDDNGQATASFQLTDAIYTIVVSKYGEILATFDNVAIYCEDSVIGDCKLNLNALGSAPDFPEWEEVGGVSVSWDFDRVLRLITVVFSSTDGSTKTVLLNTTKFDRWGNETVCSDTLTSSSGTLTCSIPDSYGNVTVVSRLFVDNGLIETRTYQIQEDIEDIFGRDNGGALMLMLLLTLPLMMVSSTIGVVLGVILAVIFGSLLKLYSTSEFLTDVSLITWIIIAGGIIIWKIKSREDT